MTTRHLISFLGKAREGATYRDATYTFEGSPPLTSRFFGHALFQHLSGVQQRPDRMVFLGTPTSMWDALGDLLDDDTALALMEDLSPKIHTGVTSEDLLPLQQALSEALECTVHTHLIPFARTPAEQVELLQILAENIETNDLVNIDITHGFRHLPMLAMVAAHYLRQVRGASIEGLWYGALEMTGEGLTPALQLDGLQEIMSWTDAVIATEASGDLRYIADQLPEESPIRKALKRAGDALRVFRLNRAAGQLHNLKTQLPKELVKGTIGHLFLDRLLDLSAWAQKKELSDQQFALAKNAIARDDPFRALSFALEAMVTRQVEKEHGQPLAYNSREAAKNTLRRTEPYKSLNQLRNTVIHASAPTGKQQDLHKKLLNDPVKLSNQLREWINTARRQ